LNAIAMKTVPSSTLERSALSIGTALIVALAPLYWLCIAVRHASYAGLGRDQGIFQGTAWAIAHGAVLYRDLREINGPLVHEIHLLARWLGGDDPHVLRSFDLIVSGLVFACFGSSLPGATSVQSERRSLLEQLAWAATACVVLLAQYVSFYSYWHLTQRESFFDWFVLFGFASVFRARNSRGARSQRAWLLLAGIASATPWFGKPLCMVYTSLHLGTFFWAAPSGPLTRRQQWLDFGMGLALGCALQLAFLGMFCGIPEFVSLYFGDNPRYYLQVWPHSVADILRRADHASFFLLAAALALGAIVLVALRELGWQMLGLALFPLCGIALELVQGKAFMYHLHPVTAGAAALTLALLCHLATTPTTRARSTLLPLLVASLVAFATTQALLASPHLRSSWIVADGSTAQSRRSKRYLRHYETATFSSAALHEVGALIARHTQPADRIQMYGMDPYLLALAQRHSATPYIYSVDLNPDAVLEGIVAQGGSASALDAARAIARRNVADFVTRVRRANPAAFIFFDRAPFMQPSSGFAEFGAHVPELRALLRNRYRELPAIGLLHVYMRQDRGSEPKTAQSVGIGIPPVSSR
jgi:hypothetical protein